MTKICSRSLCRLGFCFAIALLVVGATCRADERDVLFAAINKAERLEAQADFKGAAAQYELALARAPAVFGADSHNLGVLLNDIANLYQRMGEYTKAETLFLRGLKIDETLYGRDRLEVATSLNNLAILYVSMGQNAKAEQLYLRSLQIKEARLGPNHDSVATGANNLAILYAANGQYDKAEPLYQRSLKIWEASLGPDHINVASNLSNQGMLYNDVGQYEKAASVHLRSLKIREAKLGADHPDVAISLHNLGALYWNWKQPAKAEPFYQRSLHIWKTRLGADHPDVALSLNNLALLHQDQGQFVEAEANFQESLKIWEAKLGPEHPEVARALNNLAVLYDAMRQPEQAEARYQRSLKIWETSVGPQHPEVARVHHDLAWHYLAAGQADKAASECDLSRRIVRRYVAQVLPILSEREQLAFLEQRDEARFHRALTFGLRNRAQASIADQSAGWLINGKAVAQESLAERALVARDSTDPALADLVRNLVAVRSELGNLSLATPKAGQEAEHRRKLTELSAQEQGLARKLHQSAGRPTTADPWIETGAVRSALAADAVLVDIVRFRPFQFERMGAGENWDPARYVAWVIPPAGKGSVEIIDLGPAEAIESAVRVARKALEAAPRVINDQGEAAAEGELKKPLTALAERVLYPLIPKLGAARQIILSPDAALWLVPWGALPLADGRYAIEAYPLRYAVNGRDLVTAPRKAGQAGQSIIMANPNYDLEPKAAQAATRAVLRSPGPTGPLEADLVATRSASGLPKVGRLPGTAEEAQAIAPKLETFVGSAPLLYTDQWALEGVFKNIKRPKALVMCTHGFFLPDQEVPLDGPNSASASRTTITGEGKMVENPLLRCGLLLAGCNESSRALAVAGEDGVLTGMEIVATDLRATELVVLSACETGLGEVRNGEGVAGLRQAFQLAGAQAVVATLWQIPDRESARLMTDFFGNLASGQPKAEALRSAQLAQIEQRRDRQGAAHPFFWAAYALTGQ